MRCGTARHDTTPAMRNEVAVSPLRPRSDASPQRPLGGREGEASPFNLSLGISCGPAVHQLVELEIAACRCKSQACCCCGVGLAFKEARRLATRIEEMRHPMLLTLTVDPEWGTPREVYDRLAEKRVVGEFIRSLKKKGFITGDYYRVSEFQMGRRKGSAGTEQVHFHLIVDAYHRFIPHAYMMQRWHQLARRCFGKAQPGRESYGFVQFERIERTAIAYYVCAYLSDAAKKGLPGWFRERANEVGPHGAKYNVMLKTHSRGFFGKTAAAAASPARSVLRKQRRRRPLDERLSSCKKKANLMAVIYSVNAGGEIIDIKRQWLASVDSYADAFLIAGVESGESIQEQWYKVEGRGQFPVTPEGIYAIEKQHLFRHRSSLRSYYLEKSREGQSDEL